ncbi:hypothetical protein L3X38_007000 [Prunus dulcis]|uniref:Ionotropic glutamate receptor C-terminal domain-containing protein n=1 Tax=Prunus dulcis TaxID=3755 RepID=A0AAD4ZTV0_PRUDU|nr:hypothetical protein L3X38_007000 [Prunus dulcis]
MVVPVIDNRSKNAWAFLGTWTWDLWLQLLVSSSFLGFVVVPVYTHVKTVIGLLSSIFWERVVSNLAGFVMSVWIFVVLIQTINYTASLVSLYTFQQLQPSVTDIKDLVRKEESIGYLNNSFVYDILKHVGFDDSKIKGLTMWEIDEALSKGSRKGGVAAVVDQTPNMKLFAAKYCSKYTMIGPIFKTDGFGFVFPKRSLLIPNVSHAILKVTGTERILDTDREKMVQGRKKLSRLE